MEWNGDWYDPAHAGEGLHITEHPNGYVWANFYGYNDDLSQYWLAADGWRKDDTAVLDAVITTGPSGPSVDGEPIHTEIPWGRITLHEQGGSIDVQYKSDDGQAWGYVLQRLPVAEAPVPEPEPIPEPEPEPIPEPEPEPTPEPDTVISMRMRQMTRGLNQWGHWHPATAPITGPAAFDDDRIPATNKVWQQVEVTVTKGTLNIKRADASGEHNLRLTGVKRGEMYTVGQTFTAELWWGPQTESLPGNYGYTGPYTLESDELGLLINETMQVAYKT